MYRFFAALLTMVFIVFQVSTGYGNGTETNHPSKEQLKINEAIAISCAASNDPLECVGDASNNCQMIHDDGFDGGTTLGITTCIVHETKFWDRLLSLREVELTEQYAERDNSSFKQIISRVQAFEQAQISWRAHRDAECRFQYALWQGGTIRSIEAAGCQLSMTAKRLSHLNHLEIKN